MDRARKDILVHGGAIASGLSDPRLTHIVLHELDKSRRVELIRRTAKYVQSRAEFGLETDYAINRPRRRHAVLTGFVSACVSEGTLLDEDAFMP
jgi:DNA ligase-4